MSVKQEAKLMRRFPVAALVETAIFIAVAFVLSYVKMFRMPQGLSVTAASMLPIILIGVRRGRFFGFAGALVYSLLQMLQSFYAPPAGTALALVLMILLDYVVAYGVLGFSSFFPKNTKGILIAIPVCTALRFICHFASGIVLWGSYAEEGQAAWLYSLIYNGPALAVEAAIMMVAAFVLIKSNVIFYGIKGRT